MRQLFAVALVVGLMAVPAWAQRGGGGARGGGGGFRGGGFAGRAGYAGHAGYASGYRGAGGVYAGGVYAGRAYGVNPYVRRGEVAARPGFYGSRPVFYGRGEWNRRRGYGYGPGVGYGYLAPSEYGYGSGWVDTNDPGYGYGLDEDGGYGYGGGDGSGSGDDSDVAQEYAEQPPPYYAPEDGASQGYGAQGYGAQGGDQAVATQGPVQGEVAPSLYEPSAVTLVFKDGRPRETIHNYALTRTMLYVTDGRRQEIPVAALDMAATERVNRAAGVQFQLPVTQ